MTTAYDESAGHIKLYLPEGKIDFVVANPLLKDPFESTTLLDRAIVLERSSEIVAKKMWHRGNLATARARPQVGQIKRAFSGIRGEPLERSRWGSCDLLLRAVREPRATADPAAPGRP